MIYGRADAEEYTVTELISTATAEDPTVVCPEATPTEIALEQIAVVLIVLFIIVSTLLGCLGYALIGSLAFVLRAKDHPAELSDDVDRREPLSSRPRRTAQ